MNNLSRISYIFIICCIVIVILQKVYAVTEEELKKQKEEVENQINKTNTEIAGIKEDMTIALDQINRLNIQIKEREDLILSENENLEEIEKELNIKKVELEKATQKYNKQKELFENRMVALYESSKTTYLDVLMGSKDLSDFLSKYYMIQKIAEYDNDILIQLEEAEKEVQNENDKIEKKQSDILTVKNRLKTQSGALEVLKKDKNNIINTLSDEELILEEQLEQFENDKKEIELKLQEVIKQNQIKISITPSNSGYISPLLGKTKSNITTGYYGYSGHTGVDFAVELQTDVMAVKDGTVVISEALINGAGAYRSYGEYIVIDHHDGTMTLYAHGYPNSRLVNVGDEVKQGQIIMHSRINREFNRTTFAF